MWLRLFEVWLVNRLLSTPGFHRMVHSVQKTLREFRHGPDREEMGGTNLEKTGSNTKKFLEHYLEEIKVQLRGGRTPKS